MRVCSRIRKYFGAGIAMVWLLYVANVALSIKERARTEGV
jgi:hypothetical protein